MLDSRTLHYEKTETAAGSSNPGLHLCESDASEPPVVDFMSFPFNIFITLITHGRLSKTRVIVVANLTLCPQENNWAMLTFGGMKINP